MNRFLYIVLLILIVVSCSKSDDDAYKNNPNIPNIPFDTGNLSRNLYPYSNLNTPGNHLILNNNYGINGVVVYFAGGTNYSAFELSDPNHPLSNCSTLTVQGIVATCDCDDGNSYEILNGIGQTGTTGHYVLKRYNVEASENFIRVYNN